MLFHRQLSSISRSLPPGSKNNHVFQGKTLPTRTPDSSGTRRYGRTRSGYCDLWSGISQYILNTSQGRFQSCYKVRNNNSNNHRSNRTCYEGHSFKSLSNATRRVLWMCRQSSAMFKNTGQGGVVAAPGGPHLSLCFAILFLFC